MRDTNESFDMQATLLLTAIESFTVGLVIVAQNGTILHKNSRAEALLENLPCSSSTFIPDRLWRTCQSLVEHQDEQSDILPSDCNIVLEDEISTAQGTILMRAQWFDWEYRAYESNNCFLITLENRQQSLIAIAKQEAQRYGLTTRETEVWCLKRMDQSYKDIAKALFISENTVKKHLKNIYVKKEQSQWLV
ncbi:helix-turn-helix transcriptional regulator [Leptothoe spongobia]|uniref:Helix-turn-helix transcriptional regulator n=1 Tax=Leptothoe spongobia TAU-MAC 1115 TaxID=1967444 RepID=A0A947DCV0_9CYAN|nr:helix-turn-helix transcriptional regulator [Leptothoe spongobia]MBT9314761.1 helix-turn-helix transcriptional regulator [Leptothoe spongobia TAU-MAC 1115]